MKPAIAGTIFLIIWIGAMLLLSGSNKTDVRSYENPATDRPCEFMTGGTWSGC